MKSVAKIFLAAAVVLTVPGCSSMKKGLAGGLIGTGAGAAVGAVAGYFIGGGDAKAAAIGAAIGGGVGGGTGAIIGSHMQKKADELAAIENAKIDTITDINGLTAIKVTFDSGILFATNSSTLSAESKATLKDFAGKMADLQDTDITIWGHTDNTGTAEVNQKVSTNRANAVKTYLAKCGIAETRINAEGKSFDMPVADNATAEGRTLNRRVEVYITANEAMIEAAKTGELK